MKGCLVLGCAPLAALLLLLSFMFTMEQESFSGLRDNRSGLALHILVVGVGAALCALAAAARASGVLRITTFVVCGLLLIAAGYRAYTLVPMLKCGGASATAREQDGSFTCYDR
ncbi:hypothetical protein [Streptomyces sp. WMMB303]|uniref:hypothetical protein n=1 Tax=Streptomyces sp. WMMB303 TaxID=3034154 RepID=UPI0023EB9406|nr:hypothetical protein [Streptomyces sp. WMMB303]MDF4251846.1 hypothetical protein [Streptomyces sp. WMMB303]MDF4254524.1 hypothetical protein [Streptomyces sp. WMMB303]